MFLVGIFPLQYHKNILMLLWCSNGRFLQIDPIFYCSSWKRLSLASDISQWFCMYGSDYQDLLWYQKTQINCSPQTRFFVCSQWCEAVSEELAGRGKLLVMRNDWGWRRVSLLTLDDLKYLQAWSWFTRKSRKKGSLFICKVIFQPSWRSPWS